MELPGSSDPETALWKQPCHSDYSGLAIREALRLTGERRSFNQPVRWHVVVPCHNYAAYLEECVRSIVVNEADSLVTIVDEASTDGSRDLAHTLAARYGGIRVIELQENSGPAVAINRGIGSADSVFVVRLDADDRIGPHYLRAAGAVLTAGADVANPDALLFGDEVGRWPVPGRVTLAMLLKRNPVHCASAFRRTCWERAGGFDERIPDWEDYEFWIRVASGGARIHRVPGDHFYYRQHTGSRSRSDIDRAETQRYLDDKHAGLHAQSARAAALR